MLRLRPYKACDAQIITKWLKSECAFRQWSADRYERFPITPDDLNAYYDREKDNDRVWGLTAFHENGVVGHLTMRFPHDDQEELRLGFVIVDDQERGKGYGRELVSLAIQYAFDFVRSIKFHWASLRTMKQRSAATGPADFRRSNWNARNTICVWARPGTALRWN